MKTLIDMFVQKNFLLSAVLKYKRAIKSFLRVNRAGFLLGVASYVFVFMICPQVIADASSQQPKKVLLLHSYHAEYPWVASITKGVRDALEGENVVLQIFYMDTKRKTSQDWKVQSGKLAKDMIEKWKPDVVIAADDNAQIFVTQKYAGNKPYFVFCGVNGEPSDYGLPASNVTGVIERPHFKESVEYLQKIIPNIRKIAVISDDGPTSIGALEFMNNQNLAVKILDYHLIGDFNTWQKRVTEYNIDADALCIYMYHTVREKGNTLSMSPKEVMNWTQANCTIPTIGFFDFSIEDGMFCGVVESGEEHGYEAAKMAVSLLKGVSIESLPVKTAEQGIPMVNLDIAKGLNIIIPKDILDATKKR